MQRDGGVGPSSSRVPRGRRGSGSGRIENISGLEEGSLASQGGSGLAVPGIDIWGTVGSGAGRPWGQ